MEPACDLATRSTCSRGAEPLEGRGGPAHLAANTASFSLERL